MVLRNLSIGLAFPSDEIARINFNPTSSSTSSNNLLAYRPNFADHHTSGLVAIFINIRDIFPCLGNIRSNVSGPICKIFTYEDDGFRNGHVIIESSVTDTSTQFGAVFGDNIPAFAFALSGCPTMNNDCFPVGVEYSVVCLLPRNWCS